VVAPWWWLRGGWRRWLARGWWLRGGAQWVAPWLGSRWWLRGVASRWWLLGGGARGADSVVVIGGA